MSGVETLPALLRQQITDCGYYPELVAESIALALGEESVVAHLVHHEATFNSEEVQRHLTVLALTGTRLLVGHTDESDNNPEHGFTAITSTESIPLDEVQSVSLTRVVRDPANYRGDHRAVVETWLTLGWGTLRRVDLAPAGCADPTCDADHGYTGTTVGDDITIRMSPAADGEQKVAELVAFGTALQQTTRRGRR